MRLFLSLHLKLVLLLSIFLVGFFLPMAWASFPHNDTRDGSVESVVLFHQKSVISSGPINYISWTPVKRLESGNYKVTVQFRFKNRFERSVLKKQIVIMDEYGKILKVMDCR